MPNVLSLKYVLFGRAELFLTERMDGLKMPFLGKISKSCLPISQHLAMNTCHQKSSGDKKKLPGGGAITRFYGDFHIPGPLLHSTKLHVCLGNNIWRFLPSQ